jgi:GMP synthase-like glutamine amidotransferase
MAKRKVFIFNEYWDYSELFKEYGWGIASSLKDADLLQLTGGADVHPQFYGEEVHPRAYPHLERDKDEFDMYERAVALGKPVAGICRGAQLINIACGGKMYQHVTNHGLGGTHNCYDQFADESYQVNSVHHQMMRPTNEAVILGVVEGQASWKEYMKDGKIVRVTDDPIDYEVLYYPKVNGLCFQPHPEFSNGKTCRDPYFRYIDDYLFNGEV